MLDRKRPLSVGSTAGFVIVAGYSIIRTVRIDSLHEWNVSAAQAQQIQVSLAEKVVTDYEAGDHCLIAGVDISSPRVRGPARAAVVVLSYPELRRVEVTTVEGEISFPYIPGLLSFREGPLILAACENLRSEPDLILVDGQGIAHPRRLGLASHLGLFLDVPTIGCAKSILCGGHEVLGDERGSQAGLFDKDDCIGAALRTRSGVKPVYVSVGHKIDLASSLQWVLKCCRGYRLPEPTRLAHLVASGQQLPLSRVQ